MRRDIAYELKYHFHFVQSTFHNPVFRKSGGEKLYVWFIR